MSDSQQLDDLANMSDDELSKVNLENVYDEVDESTQSVEEPTDTSEPQHVEETTQQSTDTSLQEEPDYKAFYERLNQPFKANGQEMAIQSADEAIELMQKGANYHKKMSELKPKTKILKMLEKAELLDEDKLAYLIDLNQKNPEAIAKLVKDANIDAFDLEDKVNPEYRPQVPQVSDAELELDNVLDELRDSPSFARTVEIAGNQWDAQSRESLATNPQMLKGLNEHVYLGIYDIIQAEMNRQRTFGHLQGLSDLQAYKLVGDHLNAQGAFNYLNGPTPTQQDPALDDKRKGASIPNGSPQSTPTQINPLSMSDEELIKLVNNLR